VTPMLRLLTERSDLGAAIGRVVEDEHVLAAGGALRADASTDYLVPPDRRADHPDACFVRTTDLHGGSVVAGWRDAVTAVGGIDPAYRTVGGALADLGLALQGAGRGVLLQPECTVTASLPSASDPDVIADRERLRDRWPTMLGQRGAAVPSGEQ
jgi:hypothetical protein